MRIESVTASFMLSSQLNYIGGNAHKVAVLSAEVDKNEKSVGCQRPDMTLSACCATTTDGNGIVKSPCKSVKTNLLSYPLVSR